MNRMVLVALTLLVTAGCGGEAADGTGRSAEPLDRGDFICAGIVEFQGTRFVPVGGSARPDALIHPERGERLGRGVLARCSDGDAATDDQEMHVPVYRVKGVEPSQAVFVGKRHGLMWDPDYDG